MGIAKLLDGNSKQGKIFDIIIQILIIVSLISFSIETMPDLQPDTVFYLKIIEIVCIVIFTFEYALRVIYAENKRQYLFSFYGIIDLLAILPFYVAYIDLRAIRIFRLFRLFRIFKLFRYSRAIQRLKDAFISVKEELTLFLIATVFLLYISSVGIYYFENAAQPENFSSIFQCLWWAVATLTTVGYGDVYPITVGGKIFTSFVVLIGIGIVAVPTGIIASALTKIVSEEKNNV